MKALIISDNDEVLTKVDEVFQKNEIDTIVYHWFLKALDNLVEISPDLILISAFDYPRHWKTMVQFLKSEICRKYPVVILFRPADIPHEELKKEEILKIDGIFSSIDAEGLLKLDLLLKKIKTTTVSCKNNENSRKNTVLCENNANTIPTVDELFASDSENECEIPSVDEILSKLTDSNNELANLELPTVDSLFAKIEETNTEIPTVNNLLEFTEEENNYSIPSVSSLLSENSMEIPSVNDIAEETESPYEFDMNEDSELPTVSNLIGYENLKKTSGHFGSISDFLDSIKIPSVDAIFTQNDNIDIPTVDEISEKLNECLTISYESSQNIPTVDNIFGDSSDFTNSEIPSVDFIIKRKGEERKKHSLLAHIQELYGE